jgi:hypothetical protein
MDNGILLCRSLETVPVALAFPLWSYTIVDSSAKVYWQVDHRMLGLIFWKYRRKRRIDFL